MLLCQSFHSFFLIKTSGLWGFGVLAGEGEQMLLIYSIFLQTYHLNSTLKTLMAFNFRNRKKHSQSEC